ncbi:L,D-transpeptidase [Consotaella salsifontis]|uniref:Lipoprotein-anchoring transpeptidase ErfK/SrfK n=1 Tax=Consotaella salsifontis TaxID=1365950 RepID=A0A1T4PZM6_9HYPH|nr:L,D-transpeptidase [Consotaella salsifontis]SJZ96955.1 Lipoprotein-anchoring transpeptidase ErfK/SrfK [Consotaella salsifontis]
MTKMPWALAALLTLGLALPAPAFASSSDGARVVPVASRQLHTRKPAEQFQRRRVEIKTGETPGTIIVDTQRHFLYYVEGKGLATRYGVGVGREGFGWSGNMKIGRKEEWPGWTPPATMVRRERAKGHILPAYMPGGQDNPLGARAMYLYRNGHDSMFRIHGTNQPWSIGQSMSSGCIRMMNEDVKHLYSRADKGTKVVVIGPDGRGRDRIYQETRGHVGLLKLIFGS